MSTTYINTDFPLDRKKEFFSETNILRILTYCSDIIKIELDEELFSVLRKIMIDVWNAYLSEIMVDIFLLNKKTARVFISQYNMIMRKRRKNSMKMPELEESPSVVSGSKMERYIAEKRIDIKPKLFNTVGLIIDTNNIMDLSSSLSDFSVNISDAMKKIKGITEIKLVSSSTIKIPERYSHLIVKISSMETSVLTSTNPIAAYYKFCGSGYELCGIPKVEFDVIRPLPTLNHIDIKICDPYGNIIELSKIFQCKIVKIIKDENYADIYLEDKLPDIKYVNIISIFKGNYRSFGVYNGEYIKVPPFGTSYELKAGNLIRIFDSKSQLFFGFEIKYII